MGGVDGRGAGGLPRTCSTRFRLDVEFRARGSRPLRLLLSSACLNGGDGSVGSPPLDCFLIISYSFCLLWFLRLPPFTFLNFVFCFLIGVTGLRTCYSFALGVPASPTHLKLGDWTPVS